MSFITAYCHLQEDQCSVNGQLVLERDKLSEDPWFKQIYKERELVYPKFYKMDMLSQAGYLAEELMKRNDEGLFSGYGDDEIAMAFANQSASADTDIRFVKSYAQEGTPSPSLFVYTLPNIVLGEIAILNKWYGENMFAVLPKFVPDFFLNNTQIFMSDHSKAVLCGWLEVLAGRIDVFLFFVEQNSEHGLVFNKENLEKIRQENLGAHLLQTQL